MVSLTDVSQVFFTLSHGALPHWFSIQLQNSPGKADKQDTMVLA